MLGICWTKSLAGEIQRHITRNVFNVLANQGFLRDQGILSLESVQEFYDVINEEPKHAHMRMTHLLTFCIQPGYHELEYQPVITLIIKNSKTGNVQGHAVVLHSYDRDEDILVLTTIDSASSTGYTYVYCTIVTDNRRPDLVIGEFEDRLCLGSTQCYVLYLG